MVPQLGEYALSGAMVVGIGVLLAAFVYWRLGEGWALRAAKWGMVALAGLLTVSGAALFFALLTDDFSLSYVADHSERALPTGYKIAAFWAAQGGGMLLWAWAMAVTGAVMAWRTWGKDDLETGASLATMAGLAAFFVAILLFAGSAESPANPFEKVPTPVADGRGLNPPLQNLAMVVHPPTLFLGYAGFSAPFALLIGALVAGKRGGGGEWLKAARGWMVWAWGMLTIGIILGCWWAYTELGWGGYWAWDPVENASLLPWLTGTALLHSAVMQTKRGTFKRWTASLTVVTWLLCVFGTYITRSGIKSVHSFAASAIPNFFLVLMALTVIVGLVLILVRLKDLKGETGLEAIVSREGFLLVGNVLLVAMAVVVGVGTTLPLITELAGQTPAEVKPPAYNKVVLPMGLALAAVMATGPVLGHGGGAGRKAWRKLLAMGGAGAAVGVVVALMGFSAIWAVSAGAVVAAVIAGVVIDVVGALRARVGAGEGVAAAGVKVVSSGLRHWGAQVAHLGLAAIVAGVAGSSTYQWQHEFLGLEEGQAKTEDGVTVTFHGLAEEKRPTYDMMVARVDVADAKGRVDTLRPEVRFYHTKPDQPVWKVAVGLGLGTDVYVRLLGTDEKTGTWALQVIRNPLVNWIWVGGALLVIGGGMCLAPVGRKGANRTTEAPRPTEKEKEDGITVRRGTLRERRRQCV